MRILIVASYYPYFLKSFYEAHPEVRLLPYAEHWQALMDQCCGTTGFYSSNLRKLGHEVQEVIANNGILQRKWAIENGVRLSLGWLPSLHIYRDKRGLRLHLRRKTRQLLEILHAQIRSFSPDVLYEQSIGLLPDDFLRDVKRHVRLVVGQRAARLPQYSTLGSYDLILSSLPNMVSYFRGQGIASEYFRLGFEPKVLSGLSKSGKMYDVVFIGGLGPVHNERNTFLEDVSQQVKVDFWGYSADNVSPDSPILSNYHGEAWGLEMYNIRHSSRISINKHITSVSDRFCNNLTLYEATGVGTLLITDYKENLAELFEPWREVVPYKSAEECSELIKYYLEHEEERLAIARAGQERTLREHTYFYRMQELTDILERYVHKPKTGAQRIFNL